MTDAFVRGPAMLFWAQVLGNAGLFVALVVIARALGPGGRGTIAFIAVTAILSARVTRLGVSDATIVFAAQRPHLRPSLLTNLVLWVTAAAVVAAASVSAVLMAAPAWRPSGIGDTELAILALGILTSALVDAGYSFVLGCSRFGIHAVITVATAWLYALVVATVWVTADLTVARAALIWVAVQAVKALVLLWASARTSGVGRPDRALLRESIGFGIRAWVGSLSDALNDRIDQILIAFIATEATLGIYAVAVNAWEILLYLPGAAATAVLPSVARADRTLRVEQVLKAFRSVAIVTLSGLAIAAVVGPPLLVVRLRGTVRRLDRAVPLAPTRHTGVRRARHLLERPGRILVARPLLVRTAGLARGRHRPGPRPDPIIRSRRGGDRSERRTAHRRSDCSRPLPDTRIVLARRADPASSRRPGRAEGTCRTVLPPPAPRGAGVRRAPVHITSPEV